MRHALTSPPLFTNDPSSPEIYTLSLHDALPIFVHSSTQHPTEVQHICARLLGCDFNRVTVMVRRLGGGFGGKESNADRKSTRLNSSHSQISYAVFCLKKKNKNIRTVGD